MYYQRDFLYSNFNDYFSASVMKQPKINIIVGYRFRPHESSTEINLTKNISTSSYKSRMPSLIYHSGIILFPRIDTLVQVSLHSVLSDVFYSHAAI